SPLHNHSATRPVTLAADNDTRSRRRQTKPRRCRGLPETRALKLERETRLELATSTLARLRSTNSAIPALSRVFYCPPVCCQQHFARHRAVAARPHADRPGPTTGSAGRRRPAASRRCGTPAPPSRCRCPAGAGGGG